LIVERTKKNDILVRYRTADGKRVESKYSCNPFCYIEEENIGKLTPPFSVLPDEGYEGLYGEKLRKVVFQTTHELSASAKKVRTWEANIAHTNRVLVENNVNIPMYEHRTWFFDMEWKTESGEITIIVIHDSFEGEFVLAHHPEYESGLYDEIPCKEHPEGLKVCKGERQIKIFKDEKSLLQYFAQFMRRKDPDILTGWNVVNADCQQLFKRFKANKLDIRSLSPMRKVRYDFGEWAQPIAGYNTIDMMISFKKLWTLKNGQLPSMGLGAVSEYCLGETKVELKDGHDTYYSDFGTYLDYAMQDVRLLPKLDGLVGALDYFTAIQHIVQCDIRTTPYVSKVFPILALRDKEFKEKIPSKAQFEKVDYEGADIMKVDAGVHKNIGIMDIKAMYHSNVKLHNICWTTLDKTGFDCGNGVMFSKRKTGLLGRQMDNMTVLRNKYKEQMKSAQTDKESKKYDALQYATKSLVASMYGVAGDSKCGFYHPDIAAAITYTSRQTLFRLRDIANELGCTVRYGHTDSIMCDVASPEKGLQLLSVVNQRMNPIETEFEKWCDTFLIMAKNRYAASVSWTDGAHHDPQIYVKGIEMKQGRLPKACKSALSSVVTGILQHKNETEITSSIENLLRSVVRKEIPIADLCIKAKLSKNLNQYTTLGEARAGAHWANTHLGKGYRKDDYFLTTLDNNGAYIAFDDPSEIEGIAHIGYRHIAERFIYKKVLPYYAVMGWNVITLENALNGSDSMEWL